MTTTWKISDLANAPVPALERAFAGLDEVDAMLKPYASVPAIKSLLTASATIRKVEKVISSALSAAAFNYYSGSGGVVSAAKSIGTGTTDPFEAFWRTTVLDVQERARATNDALAKQIAETMQSARSDLDSAIAVELGPVALRENVDPQKVRLLGSELATFRPSKLRSMYRGITDDARAKMFELACEPLLLELVRLSVPELAGRLLMPSSTNGPIGVERDAVYELQREIAKRQTARRPEWIEVAEQAWRTLLSAFRSTVGYDIRKMGAAEYTQFKASPPSALAIDRSWLSKALPGTAPRIA